MVEKRHVVLLVGVLAALIWSGISPYERGTWWAEIAPILIAVPILALTYRRFRLSDLAYGLIAIHAVILMVGGHYTYARVPLGDWVRDFFHATRNDYDRLGHFAQGFVPAIIAREVLLRTTPLKRGGWLKFIVVSICLAISACYELVEWQSAVIAGSGATDFLGTQGDPWDTQKDMLMALIGATVAVFVMAKLHDRSMAKVEKVQD